jgi:hypothetical protein
MRIGLLHVQHHADHQRRCDDDDDDEHDPDVNHGDRAESKTQAEAPRPSQARRARGDPGAHDHDHGPARDDDAHHRNDDAHHRAGACPGAHEDLDAHGEHPHPAGGAGRYAQHRDPATHTELRLHPAERRRR